MDHSCACDVCRCQKEHGITHEEAVRQSNARDAHNMEKYGWVAHIIVEPPVSIHTHGLPKNYGHKDLEIRLPASPKQLHELVIPLAEAVKQGARFEAGGEDRTAFNVPVRFIERDETGRTVLRAIFPDPEGRFPGDPGCQPGYAEQLVQD